MKTKLVNIQPLVTVALGLPNPFIMPTDWKYRAIVLIPSAVKDQVNAQITASVDPGGHGTFTLLASATGDEPATHTYANSAITITGVAFMKQLAATIPTGEAWIWVAHESGTKEEIEAVVDNQSNIHVEDSEKSIDEILSSKSLQKILPPDSPA